LKSAILSPPKKNYLISPAGAPAKRDLNPYDLYIYFIQLNIPEYFGLFISTLDLICEIKSVLAVSNGSVKTSAT
jgi:hypothetical protein